VLIAFSFIITQKQSGFLGILKEIFGRNGKWEMGKEI
jgi:hypothetical protein